MSINYDLQVWTETMDGNEDAFVKHGAPGIQKVLDNPGLLLFETNHWEDSYKRLVALNIQDRVPISDAFAFQKGSEFLFMFNHFLRKMHESGVIDKMNRDWSLREELDFEIDPAVNLGYENVAFPFIILVGGLLFSCVLTLFESGFRKSAGQIKSRSKRAWKE